MRYVMTRLQEETKKQAYRIYITESLFAYGENKRLTMRYTDMLKPVHRETRSGDEIALDVISRLGLKVK